MEQKTKDHNLPSYYVDVYGRAAAKCPNCGHESTLTMAKYKGEDKKFKVRCRCGVEYRANFTFEQTFSKDVNLDGSFQNRTTRLQDDITIEKLSMDGVGFSTLAADELKVGDSLRIVFILDNKLGTEVTRNVKVTSIKGAQVGARFDENLARNATVGFYLMP